MKEVLVLYNNGNEYLFVKRQSSSPSSTDPADFGLSPTDKVILVMSGGGHNSYKILGKEIMFHG